MINIAIVDDNKSCLDNIEMCLKDALLQSEYVSIKFDDGEKFLNVINAGAKFDIIILDIVLDQMCGIEVGEIVSKLLPNSNLIFVSANPQYYKDVYKVRHTYFLTKPIEESRFKDAISKSVKHCINCCLTVTHKGVVEKIYFSNILYIESYLRYVNLHLTNGRIIEKFEKISSIEVKLPSNFVRCQKCFIVNLDHAVKIENGKIFISNNDEISISRNKLFEIKEKYTMYLGGEL